MSKYKVKFSPIEATKNLLLQEQKGNFENIILGNAQLLTADDIAQRLGISIDVFHRWVKNADHKYQIPMNSALETLGNSLTNALSGKKENTAFAKPDVYIGSYPRWTVETFRNWLRSNLK